jgi:Zn finger protein HypA/HybF involved in hydrogenase expression
MVSPQLDPKGTQTLPLSQPPASLNTLDSGIVVREEELGTVKAQRVYKMRCECGRSWFELELPKFVECPACKKLGLVSA